ncbi:hypothetical protein [Lachnospira multipara]|uniref:hypothetical protein n=1 Tax=Lachnospira multipara TaxID=28051 RepID=UPI0004E0EEB1|nr:hypothetical protein [Lachnospira multipara]
MIFTPKALGSSNLDKETLIKDKRECIKFGPCGLGKKAIYLNSFYIDRMYYAELSKIDRVFKRVAMSKGGFTGKGLFGSIPYLVVLFKDGSKKVCNFKYEEHVDEILEAISEDHPEIPTHSVEAEKRLLKAKREEEARYIKNLSKEALNTINKLENAKKELEKDRTLSNNLAFSAKQKRTLDAIHPTYRLLAIAVFLAAAACAAFGIHVVMTQGFKTGGLYVLVGFAFIFFVISAHILPTGTNNKRYGENCYKESVQHMENKLKKISNFPVPASYAHPIVIDRMIRVIREGRAFNEKDAMEVVKKDLKALNPSVKVTQKEYDEVVIVKPLFTVIDYK